MSLIQAAAPSRAGPELEVLEPLCSRSSTAQVHRVHVLRMLVPARVHAPARHAHHLPLRPIKPASNPPPGRSGTAGTRSARSTSGCGALPSAACGSAASCRGSAPRRSSPGDAPCRRASSARPGGQRSPVGVLRSSADGRGATRPDLAEHLDAFAVRRVEHQRAGQVRGQCGRRALERVATVENDGLRDAGALGVAAREVDHAERDVAGMDRHRARMDARLGVQSAAAATATARRRGANGTQALEREAAPQPRRDAAGDLRRLDRDRARAATGVVQRAARLGRCRASRRRPTSPRPASPSAARRPCRARQPRLNSGSPELSTYRVARSGPRCSTSCRSGWRVSTLGRSPVASRSASQTPSLMRSAAKFRLRSGERCAVVSTRSVWRGVIHSVQSTRRASS